ncbi:A/G-specific adenine glycosylase [Uliginosibacterium sp. 31-12]|uniref:A/G-specific adenine glycosylase n=1 Tax=Uliginosibacterium sp. 31-12 TaxID=3062781 RepID=UPI0026E3F081|nr:A/G-specific adenine glycosylase [Uliginosibacterium sp. 31-12]MDO6387067.1 A/G-specific adenine glycosylase [Uliginosibacterium sp. 31-12]
MSDFATRLMAWQRQHGRHDLPWQNTRDPYRVWLSEIMLQQTQVDTVIPYYLRFLVRFPDVAALATAPLDEVLALWAGLGYYARARNLHRAAQAVMSEHGGRFPATAALLTSLPGIGRSTAAAIASFCYGERVAILDGNVKRVLCRHFGISGFPGERAVEQQLWALAESLLPETGLEIYPQAQMDLGATLCTRSRPRCEACPLSESCHARAHGLTASLPVPRPKKAQPQRSAELLLIEAEGTVLLEQRPLQGIWGGLFSLPEMIEGETPAQAALRYLGQAPQNWEALPPVQHVFTHFRLQIQPWRTCLARVPPGVAQAALRWVSREALAQLGLPAPIRKLLEA